MKKYRVIILFFCFFIFYGDLRFSAAEEDLKAKVEARLLKLKETVMQEQLTLRAANEKLLKDNEQLTVENARLKEMLNKQENQLAGPLQDTKTTQKKPLARSEEKISYKTDPTQQKHIQELKQKITQLNVALENKNREIAQNDNQMRGLERLVDNANKQVKELEQMVTAANKPAEDNNRNLITQQEKLKQELEAKDERIGLLEEKLSNLPNRQDETQNNLKEKIQRLADENNQLKLALQVAKDDKAALTQQINSLEGEAKIEPKEKTVYQADPSQQKRIQELEQKITELNNLLLDKAEVISQKEQEISSLRDRIDNAYSRIDDILGGSSQ